MYSCFQMPHTLGDLGINQSEEVRKQKRRARRLARKKKRDKALR